MKSYLFEDKLLNKHHIRRRSSYIYKKSKGKQPRIIKVFGFPLYQEIEFIFDLEGGQVSDDFVDYLLNLNKQLAELEKEDD